MFPGRLSNDLCSLRPGEERLVQSAVFDLNAKGEVRKVRFADGIIRSAARLTYTQVAEALEGKSTGGMPRELLDMLEAADRLRGLLERRRHARGSIDFDLPEPQILLDVEGVMTGIVVEPRNHAHRMIEEFMLLANDAVAEHLEAGGAPSLYRVHDAPDPIKLAKLSSFVKGFGLELGTTGAEVEPGQIQRLLERAEGRPEFRVISQVALRSMKQARYSPENTGHFGLASPAYSHFTSPIRRYPDLVVHRLLRDRRLRRVPPGQQPSTELLEEIARTGSELERNAEAAERELLVWKKVAFIADKLGEPFDGIVTGVTRFGLFVQLVDNLVEGLVRIELLGEEWFEFDEGRFELRGADTGMLFRLGDRMRVRVDRVDRALLRVDFSPEKTEAAAGRRRKRRSQTGKSTVKAGKTAGRRRRG
jgi:ribonuclease R